MLITWIFKVYNIIIESILGYRKYEHEDNIKADKP